MILVDTNILINYFKGEDSILDTLIDQDDVALCGIVLSELLHGVNSNKEKELIDEAIQDFEWIHIDDSIWHEVGNNLNLLRKNGVNIPFQGCSPGYTLHSKKDIPIATGDNHFYRIAEVLTNLKIHS